MTTYRHIIFRITMVAFLAAFLTFISGCGGDEEDEDSGAPVKSKLQIVYSQHETNNPDWRPPAEYTVQTSEGWYKETGCAVEIKHEESGIVLRLVHAGEFDMGSPEGESGRGNDEGPVHRVKISEPFYIGKYEVTNEQYCKFLNAKAAHSGDGHTWLDLDDEYCMIEKREGKYYSKNGYERHPVVEVSWWGAKAFCEWVGGRLPTEAEWEYACRAGTTTPFNTGDTLTTDQANYDGNHPYGGGPKGVYRKKTTEVGSFAPNDWGLHDMHGNVFEWCEDVFHENYTGAPNDGSAWTTGGDQSPLVLRGGSWVAYAGVSRSANRSGVAPDDPLNDFGVRVVAAGKNP
ncbi:MAG: formylglycine-generating enzyme family protein [Planctomycetota bacterium]